MFKPQGELRIISTYTVHSYQYSSRFTQALHESSHTGFLSHETEKPHVMYFTRSVGDVQYLSHLISINSAAKVLNSR